MSKLIKYAKYGDSALVESQLLKGVDPNQRDRRGTAALHWAAQEGYIEVIRLLIMYQADVNALDGIGFTPLARCSVAENQCEIAIELLNAGALPDIRLAPLSGGTVLHSACAWERLDMVKILLEFGGANVNIKDNDGATPLWFAKDGGFKDIEAYLTARGAI